MPRLRPQHLEVPLSSRLAPGHPRQVEIMERHRRAVESSRPVYADPTSGLAVFTARFLAERGFCCGSGCRHCPYEPA